MKQESIRWNLHPPEDIHKEEDKIKKSNPFEQAAQTRREQLKMEMSLGALVMNLDDGNVEVIVTTKNGDRQLNKLTPEERVLKLRIHQAGDAPSQDTTIWDTDPLVKTVNAILGQNLCPWEIDDVIKYEEIIQPTADKNPITSQPLHSKT